MSQSMVKEFTKGLWAEVPPFRLVLGLCPVLAVTKSVENGIGMGVATTFVLVCSNLLVSLLFALVPLMRARSVSAETSRSQRLTTRVATPLPMKLVSARHSLMNRSTPRMSAMPATGTAGTTARHSAH